MGFRGTSRQGENASPRRDSVRIYGHCPYAVRGEWLIEAFLFQV